MPVGNHAVIFPTLFLSSPFLFTPYHIPVLLLQLCLSFSSFSPFSPFSSFSPFSPSSHTPRPSPGLLVSPRRFFSFPIKIFRRNLFVCWPRFCFSSRTCLHFRRYGYRVSSFPAHAIRFSLVIHATKSPLVSTTFCEARFHLILRVSFILSRHFLFHLLFNLSFYVRLFYLYFFHFLSASTSFAIILVASSNFAPGFTIRTQFAVFDN